MQGWFFFHFRFKTSESVALQVEGSEFVGNVSAFHARANAASTFAAPRRPLVPC